MSKTLAQLSAFTDDRKLVNVIIETPMGAAVKYSYRPESGAFYAKRLLPPGMVFPFNFGFIPSTLGDDGDPLDIVLLNEVPVACGSLVRVSLEDIKTGEGKILKLDGRKAAAYRDANGNVTVLLPVCTHPGCIVRWNKTDQTLDFPCHGSRFHSDGNVFSGPAETSQEKFK